MHLRIAIGLVILTVFGLPERSSAQAPPQDPNQSFTFCVFGDNRPSDDRHQIPQVFNDILADIRKHKPVFVVTTGDLILGDGDLNSMTAQYDAVLPSIKSLGVPVYFASGNHEIKNSGLVSPSDAQKLYLSKVYPKLYYSFDYGNSHFVILDSNEADQMDKIAGDQLAWLQKDLDAAEVVAKHVFVFEHEPPYPVSKHIGSSLDKHSTERNAYERVLEAHHIDALITGHEHLYDYSVVKNGTKGASVSDGIIEIEAGGAGAPLMPSKTGGSFNNYLIVHVEGDKVTISVVRMKPYGVFSADTDFTRN